MKYRLPLVLLAVASATFLPAQAQPDDDDEDFTDLGYYANAKNTLTFGFRMTQGAKVRFGNLGTVPSIRDIAPHSDGEKDRVYDNGAVAVDGLRIGEFDYDADGNPVKDADGNIIQTSTQGGRYKTYTPKLNDDGTTMVDENGDTVYVQTGDYLSYTPGRTRNWSYNDDSQILTDGSGIRMSAYSAKTEGAGMDSDSPVSNGIELEVSRQLRKFGERFKLSLVGGIALSNINNKAAGSVRATLHTLSDVYSLNGQTAPALPEDGTSYLAPTYSDLTLDDGTTVVTDGYETTTPISTTPVPGSRTETDTAGAANVSGAWQIKGAYFVFRIGPQLQAMVTKSVGLQAGAGLAAAYVGTTYKVTEKLEIDGVNSEILTTETSDYSKFLPGYYANVDASWALNERTGLFAGASYEAFGDYTQTVGGRTATIDLGGQAGVRGGLNVKF